MWLLLPSPRFTPLAPNVVSNHYNNYEGDKKNHVGATEGRQRARPGRVAQHTSQDGDYRLPPSPSGPAASAPPGGCLLHTDTSSHVHVCSRPHSPRISTLAAHLHTRMHAPTARLYTEPCTPAPACPLAHCSLSFFMPLSRHLRSRQAWHCRRVFRVISQAPFRKGHLRRALRFMALL